jgi:hypothetical protein
LTDKNGIPLSVVISPASTHDINLVTDVVDNTVIRQTSSKSKNKRRQQQRLCLDKGYNSAEEEKELIKRDYVLHIPIKKKKKKKKGINNEKEIPPSIATIKQYSPKRWVVYRKN